MEILPRTQIIILNGQGCVKCKGELLANRYRLTQKAFVTKARNVHGKKYNYKLVNYKNNKTKITIICPFHGKFKQSPADHLQGKGCKKCAINNQVKIKTYTVEHFISLAQKIHHNTYSYANTVYKNSSTKIIITCYQHGNFLQKPNNHLQGQGCPICHLSRGEKIIYQFLLDKRIPFISEYSDQNCRNKKALFFDFAIGKENNILGLIEYQGSQHYKPQTFGSKSQSGKQMLLGIQKNDKIKLNYCKINNIPLLCIPYYQKDNILIIVEKFLNSINIFLQP